MANKYKVEQIQVAPGFIIVKPQEVAETVKGIYQPGKEQEIPQWGKVIAAGDIIQIEPPALTLKAGQTVIYRKYGGNDVEIGGQKYYFLKYDEIIGVVK